MLGMSRERNNGVSPRANIASPRGYPARYGIPERLPQATTTKSDSTSGASSRGTGQESVLVTQADVGHFVFIGF
jgi:hypothetical protein